MLRPAVLVFALLLQAVAVVAYQLPLIPPSTPRFPLEPAQADLDFTLRHIYHHGANRYPNLHRKMDISPRAPVWFADDESDAKHLMPPLLAQSEPARVQRLVDRSPQRIESLLAAARAQGETVQLEANQWTIDTTPGPNVTDKKTVLTLAHIAANAYVEEPWTGDWEDVKGGFNYTQDFGWQGDGLRGHIFADTKNKTVIIGLKGTTAAVWDGAGSTTQDKVNDNLLFGCCCGQGTHWYTHQVCDCMTSTYSCNQTCVRKALHHKSRYYYAGQDLYHNVTALYPDAEIWLVGHSLGGAISSLLGMTFGRHAVTFEAPGDAMASARLGLPTPPEYHLGSNDGPAPYSIHHFGHNADPVYMGTCNGGGSFCDIGGYAMESVCHTGKECIYDTQKDLGWDQSLFNHRITTVIRSVISAYNVTPPCKPVTDCTDCYLWKFYESNSSSTTTTSSSTSSMSTTSFSRTRTQTCQTPGWWGCLDESTTSAPTTSTTTSSSSSSFSSTSTSSTSTCHTPGWFGCLDPTSTSPTASHTTMTPSTTSTYQISATFGSSMLTETCETPGLFWGCWDSTESRRHLSTSSTSLHNSLFKSMTASTGSHRNRQKSCSMPGMFWGCWDPAAATATAAARPTLSTARATATAS